MEYEDEVQDDEEGPAEPLQDEEEKEAAVSAILTCQKPKLNDCYNSNVKNESTFVTKSRKGLNPSRMKTKTMARDTQRTDVN
jgi:hypothetical protein